MKIEVGQLWEYKGNVLEITSKTHLWRYKLIKRTTPTFLDEGVFSIDDELGEEYWKFKGYSVEGLIDLYYSTR